jgi:hypothetical protein
LSNIKIYLNL